MALLDMIWFIKNIIKSTINLKPVRLSIGGLISIQSYILPWISSDSSNLKCNKFDTARNWKWLLHNISQRKFADRKARKHKASRQAEYTSQGMSATSQEQPSEHILPCTHLLTMHYPAVEGWVSSYVRGWKHVWSMGVKVAEGNMKEWTGGWLQWFTLTLSLWLDWLTRRSL